jgi:NAD(P)-dependent dehydrogenase (short-subunit alcohol dehydrogenase family)
MERLMDRQLAGKLAVISGGSSGIGRATALLFARHGAETVILDMDTDGGRGTAAEIVDGGGKSIFIAADVAQMDDCSRAVSQVQRERDNIDILFNNAGIIQRKTVLELTAEEWDRAMAVNVRSIFCLSKLILPIMVSQGGGVIINVASGWGLTGGPRAVSYCASKGAVVQLTRAMAIDHGRDQIRVNCICPGDTDTGMLADEARQIGEDADAFRAAAADRPLRRIGSPGDIANAALFLASDASSYMTGAALVVDGGGLAG